MIKVLNTGYNVDGPVEWCTEADNRMYSLVSNTDTRKENLLYFFYFWGGANKCCRYLELLQACIVNHRLMYNY